MLKKTKLTIQITKPVVVWCVVGSEKLEATLRPGQLVECDKIVFAPDYHILHLIVPIQPDGHTEDTPAVYVWKIEPDSFRLAPSELLKN